jgi:hypothetical protein
MTKAMSQLSLRDVASINSGYTLRTKVKDSEKGAMRIVQAKDVTSLLLNATRLPRMDVTAKNPQLLHAGDVLLSARGTFRATVFTGPLLTIASSSVYVISPQSTHLLPEFLAIYLNSPQAQSYFGKHATGASIKSLLVEHLRNMAIPLPPIDRQRALVDLYLNVEKQNNLLIHKISLNTQIAQNSINTALQGALA